MEHDDQYITPTLYKPVDQRFVLTFNTDILGYMRDQDIRLRRCCRQKKN